MRKSRKTGDSPGKEIQVIKSDLSQHVSSLAMIEMSTNNQRQQWGHSVEFLMSCISMSVGLGNIWRFPYTAYENGGGAFLIPYLVVLLLIGKPMYYFEMILGQFTSQGSIKGMAAIPILKGVAFAQQISTTSIATYYCSLIALTLFYMFNSLATELPWSNCMDKWKDGVTNCIPSKSMSKADIANGTSSSELFFIREVIKEKSDITDGVGLPDWQLTLWLLLAWICIYLVIVKGVRSSGKASYFLAIFPYAVMFILLVRVLTLDGSWNGIKYFITPDFSRLMHPQTWYAAVTQMFFSLSVGMGSIVVFSSYNQFNHNIYRDAMIVTTLDTFTSLLGGFTIFGILGNLAYNSGVEDIKAVLNSGGTGLAFISYPDAISKFAFIPQLFSVLFFFMLFTLGVGSAVGLQSSIVTNLMDFFPKLKNWQMAGICCIGGFLVGLVYVTPGGQWILNLVDHFGGTFLVFALAILEFIGVIWLYGLESFCWDIEFMLKRKVESFWRISWLIVAPTLMIVILTYRLVTLEDLTYAGKPYPENTLIIGWFIVVSGIVQPLIWGIWTANQKDFGAENSEPKLKLLFKPNPKWGPKSPEVRTEWMNFKEQKLQKRQELSENHSKLKQICWLLMGKYDE